MNPYAAPQAVIAPPVDASYSSAVFARKSARFIGSFIDTIVVALVGFAVSRVFCAMTGFTPSLVISQFSFIAAQGMNWVLLTQRGQSLGKIAMGTKVIRTDGGRAGFMSAVGLRAFPLVIIGLLPLVFEPLRLVVSIVGLVDALAIFHGTESRTLHDRIAGTIVIDLKATNARYALPRD